MHILLQPSIDHAAKEEKIKKIKEFRNQLNRTTPLRRKVPFLPLNASKTGCGTELSSKDASMLLIRRKKDQLRQKLKEVSMHIEEEDRISTISLSKEQTEEEVRCPLSVHSPRMHKRTSPYPCLTSLELVDTY